MASATESDNIKTITARVYNIPDAGELTDIAPSGEYVDFPEIISFDYYESIHENHIRARLFVYDSAGAIDKAFDGCGLRQFCPVEIELIDPAIGTDWERSKKSLQFMGSNCFYINKVAQAYAEGKKKTYALELINKDAIVAFNTTVKAALPPDNTTKVDYNSAINLALEKYIKTTKDFSNINNEMSESVAKIMGNGMKTYQYINHICTKATPKGTGTGQQENRATGYVFYETYENYRFDSIFSLVTVPSNPAEYGSYQVGVVNDGEVDGEQASYIILNYKFYDASTQTSLLEEIATGQRGAKKKRVMDVARNKFTDIEKVTENKPTCLAAASDGQLTDIVHSDESQYQIEFYKICEPNALDNEPTSSQLTSMNYPATLNLLKGRTATLRVPGNLTLTAGSHIFLKFPEIKADSGKDTEISPKYSGYYLITKLNHKVEEIQHVYTVLEVVKLVTS